MPMKKNRRPTMRPMPEEGSATKAMTEDRPTMRPVMRPEGFAERAERQSVMGSDDAAYRASRREAEDLDVQKFAKGGEVRGCKAGQMSGKGFSGNY